MPGSKFSLTFPYIIPFPISALFDNTEEYWWFLKTSQSFAFPWTFPFFGRDFPWFSHDFPLKQPISKAHPPRFFLCNLMDLLLGDAVMIMKCCYSICWTLNIIGGLNIKLIIGGFHDHEIYWIYWWIVNDYWSWKSMIMGLMMQYWWIEYY